MATQTPLNIINVFPSEASYESNKGSLGENEISLVSGVGVILESYTSDTLWYRKWSDGWIEQGGCLTFAGKSGTTVTFTHPFTDTNYQIVMSDYSDGSSSVQYNHLYSRNKANTNCKIYAGCNESISIQWYAFGQGA